MQNSHRPLWGGRARGAPPMHPPTPSWSQSHRRRQQTVQRSPERAERGSSPHPPCAGAFPRGGGRERPLHAVKLTRQILEGVKPWGSSQSSHFSPPAQPPHTWKGLSSQHAAFSLLPGGRSWAREHGSALLGLSRLCLIQAAPALEQAITKHMTTTTTP